MDITNTDDQNKFEQYLACSDKTLVLFVVNDSPGLKYGVGTYLKQIVSSFCHADSYDFIILVVKAYINGSSAEFKVVNNVPHYYIRKNNQENDKYFKSVYYYLYTKIKAERKIILHCNYANQLSLAELFKMNHNVSLIYTQHYMDWCIRYGPHYECVKNKIQRDYYATNKFKEEQKMMALSDLILVSARHSYEALKSIYNIATPKIRVLPLAVRLENYKLDLPCLRKKYNLNPDQRVILYVGRLDENKGVNSLIESFSKIYKKNEFLWIVGDGDFNWCLKHINEKNWSNITIWGFQPTETLSEMYAISEFGIVPSLYEEFGLVALEMMASGLPIIVRDTTGLNNIVEDGKLGDLFSEFTDRPSLSDVMRRRLNNPHDARFKNDMKQFITDKHSIWNYSKKLFEYYDFLINNSK